MRWRRQYGPAATTSFRWTGGDLAGWLILAAIWDGIDNPVRITMAVVLFIVPLAGAYSLVHRCTAWRVTEHTRCEQRRPGPFRRCADHAGQVVTDHDVAAVICVLVGVTFGIGVLVR